MYSSSLCIHKLMFYFKILSQEGCWKVYGRRVEVSLSLFKHPIKDLKFLDHFSKSGLFGIFSFKTKNIPISSTNDIPLIKDIYHVGMSMFCTNVNQSADVGFACIWALGTTLLSPVAGVLLCNNRDNFIIANGISLAKWNWKQFNEKLRIEGEIRKKTE